MIAERPAGPPPEADDDRRAYVRMQLAALMLLRGDDVGDVVLAADVPVAMLELLRGDVGEEVDFNQQRRATAEYVRRRRPRRIAVLMLEVAAVANVVVGLTALIGHFADPGLLASLVAAALIIAVSVMAKYSTSYGMSHPLSSGLRPPRWRVWGIGGQ